MSQKNPQLQVVEQPSKEAFNSWKKNDITQKLFYRLTEERKQMLEGVVYDLFENADAVKGRVHAVDSILNVTWDDLYGE